MKAIKRALILLNIGFSYWIGYLTYVLLLGVVWQQTIGGGDRNFVLFWTASSYLFVCIPFYLLIVRIIRDKARSRAAAALLGALGCGLYFVVPAVFLLFLFASFGRAFFTPEAALFYSMYFAAGFTFGLIYGLIQRLPDGFGAGTNRNAEARQQE